MNPHLNIFNNYREDYSTPLENNLTRAFIITLHHEPNLLRDFMYLISGEMSWDKVSVSIQDKNIDISGFERVIGLALTSKEIDDLTIAAIGAYGSATPIPDFLIYNTRVLIVGEVKKHSENPVAQLKNQLNYLIEQRSEKGKEVDINYKALSWTMILSKLIIPHINYHKKSAMQPVWANNFKDYIATHYTDWLPVPTLDKVDFSTDEDSVTKQLIEKRLHTIQGFTRFGTPNYWVGGRITMPIDFGWATEALVQLTKHHNRNAIQITIWPADTKAQGYRIFYKGMDWVNATSLTTSDGLYELDIYPYVKFSHVMGKWIGAINFNDEFQDRGKQFHTRKNFEKFCKSWDRGDWPELEQKFDNEFSEEFDWRAESGWDPEFRHSGRNFVFISMGFECNIFIPFEQLQAAEKSDPSGNTAAALLQNTIESFQTLVNQT
ncbi:hypothetical protein [Mucilaginibacter celer]|uniref:Uncharacterized protein n=1 Tax=Mucilaginibacter celer TaxID=2305508 RepID=A0A494VJP2_9SPHI|nr:hypothetical protein [Mucilaginibacter celer]AYL95287.1 hypothetical protein HYN43_008255 [Mucilaginibacter celer]